MNQKIVRHFLSTQELMQYLGLSRSRAMSFSKQIGALRHFEGINKWVHDRRVIDNYLDAQKLKNS